MNEIDKKEPPEVSGGYKPRPDDGSCTEPPTLPNFPQFPAMPIPAPWPGDTDSPFPPAPLF